MLTQLSLIALPKLIVAVVLCLPIVFKKEKKIGLTLVFFVSVFFYGILLRIGHPLLDPQWLDYNWGGKILVVLFALAVIYLVKIRNNNYNFGITLKQKAGSVKPVLYVAAVYFILEILFLVFFRGQHNFSLEGYLYEATLPGIAEEIFYRGLLLGLLNEIFPRKKTIFGAKVGYGALVVTILFLHGLNLSFYNISFNWSSIIITLYFGSVIVWMRERTDSVLIPILFHNMANELIYLTLTFK